MAKLIHPLLCCGLAVLCLGMRVRMREWGQNWIWCNAKRSLSLLLQWRPCSFQVVKTGFNPAPDDFTPARNCQDPTESIKKNTTETKERELWGKSSLGTGLLTHQARAREKFTPIENSIQSLGGRGERTLFPPNHGNSTPRLRITPPTTAKFQDPRPSPASLFHIPSPALYASPQLPQTSSLTGR